MKSTGARSNDELDESVSYASLAQSLARNYLFVYHVNLDTEEFVRYEPNADQRELVVGLHEQGFFSVARDSFALRVHPDDRDAFLAAVSKENVRRVLSVDRSFILTFRALHEGKETFFEVKATRMREDDEANLVVGIADVDAHMKRVEEYERYRRDNYTFASILEAMAADYLSIYYVHMDTDEFVSYDPDKIYRGVGIDRSGTDFFGGAWKGIMDLIYVDDRPAVEQAFSKENLERELAEHSPFIIICRIVRDGKVMFVSIKATRMRGEGRHIVIGINDIDEQVRREEAHAQALGAAQAIANRDSLTGVKSKHAFTEAEAGYERMVKEGTADAFAVVVCDVNGLKAVNDVQGHKAGDELIKKASALVCECFKHSPVYRVGGDEFVAILSGADYENRVALLERINGQVDANSACGGVIVAVGASDYQAGVDRDFLSVFERADAAMYARKAALKAC